MATPKKVSKKTQIKEAQKRARLELRATQSQKDLIESAAGLRGESVTSFMLSAALRDANAVVKEFQITELSMRDWKRFMAIVNLDQDPNSQLVQAMRQYQIRVVASDGT